MELVREKTVCFTGHRAIRSEEREKLERRLSSAIDVYVRRGYDTFVCGGAVGFDTLAASAVAEKKKNGASLRLVLALPCRDQTARWTATEDLAAYKAIMGSADEVFYTSDFYTKECMHVRNRFMVDNSSVCISYKYTERGGTAYTVNYAKKQGVELINLASQPEQLKIEIS